MQIKIDWEKAKTPTPIHPIPLDTQMYIKELESRFERIVAELEEYIEYDTFDYAKEEPLINMSFEKLEDIICNGGKEQRWVD